MTRDDCRSRRNALVIVAKYPRPGHVKTRLGASIGFEQAARLYRAFLRDLAQRFTGAALAGEYDLIWACADDLVLMARILGPEAQMMPQCGEELAQRLYQVCRDTASLGYARTIILGSDSPHVSAEAITRAFTLLESADVVLGPADDGGYYLAGLRNHPTPPDIFTGIVMSTSEVFAQTLERVDTLGLSVRQIEATFDVDTTEDMLRLAHLLDGSPALAPHTHALLESLSARAERPEGDANGDG